MSWWRGSSGLTHAAFNILLSFVYFWIEIYKILLLRELFSSAWLRLLTSVCIKRNGTCVILFMATARSTNHQKSFDKWYRFELKTFRSTDENVQMFGFSVLYVPIDDWVLTVKRLRNQHVAICDYGEYRRHQLDRVAANSRRRVKQHELIDWETNTVWVAVMVNIGGTNLKSGCEATHTVVTNRYRATTRTKTDYKHINLTVPLAE